MKSPVIRVAVDAGKAYYRYSCGLRSKQLFCDESHKKDRKNNILNEEDELKLTELADE